MSKQKVNCAVDTREAGLGHALLSASSSHRWLNCPPSARLCENYEDKGSEYAAEGTSAHMLCEYKLKVALGIRAKDPTADLSLQRGMEDCANGYAAYTSNWLKWPNKAVPTRLSLSNSGSTFPNTLRAASEPLTV